MGRCLAFCSSETRKKAALRLTALVPFDEEQDMFAIYAMLGRKKLALREKPCSRTVPAPTGTGRVGQGPRTTCGPLQETAPRAWRPPVCWAASVVGLRE